jgi:anti-anti-sigma factor
MRDEALSFTINPGDRDGLLIMKLMGPVTLSNIFPLQTELSTTAPKVLVVDMSDVPYMDSAGLGVLINYYVRAKKHGRDLLLAGVNERVDALFTVTNTRALLKIYPTVAAAQAVA